MIEVIIGVNVRLCRGVPGSGWDSIQYDRRLIASFGGYYSNNVRVLLIQMLLAI